MYNLYVVSNKTTRNIFKRETSAFIIRYEVQSCGFVFPKTEMIVRIRRDRYDGDLWPDEGAISVRPFSCMTCR